jgi:hypothetical protein
MLLLLLLLLLLLYVPFFTLIIVFVQQLCVRCITAAAGPGTVTAAAYLPSPPNSALCSFRTNSTPFLSKRVTVISTLVWNMLLHFCLGSDFTKPALP